MSFAITFIYRLLATAACVVAIVTVTAASGAEPGGVDDLEKIFQTPPDDARPMMRWWWFGPAVTHAEISRELRAMKDAGIGGVELQSVYPLALDDPAKGIKNLPFLSDEHLDALRHANREARALGLRVDLTLGSGWPYGGPTVPIDQAAGRLRVERVTLAGGDQVRVPALAGGEALLALFLTHADGDTFAPENTREVHSGADGTVALPADRQGADELLVFISSRTKQQVKRAAVGAEGNVLDHYDRAAVDAYLKNVGDRLMQAFDDGPPHAVFCDSLEVYGSDWTPDLLAEFQKRRGYDLKPLLPALAGDFGPRTAEIRADRGRTLTELLEERFVQPVREWAARQGTLFRFQGYGIPPARLSTARLVDLPEGEGAQWKSLSATRWASSASHLYGKPVTSAETWTWLHTPAFRATPLDLKAEADLHFLSGVNQLIGHGWPYSPPGVEEPGWRFYAAGALNDHNPWWIVMPDLTRYLQRVSALLRQGQPANDVAVYLPNDDAWARFHDKQEANLFTALQKQIGRTLVPTILEAGHGLDFFDDEALRAVGKVEQGALLLGANRYRAVVLPDVERLPLETLKLLADFARHGGVLIATRRLPERVPGFQAVDAEQREAADLIQRLFKTSDAPAHFVADDGAALAAALGSLVAPDVAFSGDRADLGFVHRHTGDTEIYFFVNTGSARRVSQVTIRANGGGVEWWHPMTGKSETAGKANGDGSVTVPLVLEPYESRFAVLSRRTVPVGRVSTPEMGGTFAPVDLSNGWQVSLDGGKTVWMEKLRSWTEDEDTRFYSGHGTYEKSFELPPEFLQERSRVRLDFGEPNVIPAEPLHNGTRAWVDSPVREVAVVTLNGESIGAIWHPPYALDITHALRPGTNRLKVVIGNTAINGLARTRPPDYRELTRQYGERFKAQDMDGLRPIPSGLLGPVRLVPGE